jgi:hypothetical protein
MFEAGMLALWGLMLIALGGYIWKFGPSPTAKALIAPFLLAGLLWGGAGVLSLYRNAHRVAEFTQEYAKDPATFVTRENTRVDGFSWSYRYLLLAWTASILTGLLLFFVWGGDRGRAAGIGLIVFGVSGLLVDHTSEHNAIVYKAAIVQALGSRDVHPL